MKLSRFSLIALLAACGGSNPPAQTESTVPSASASTVASDPVTPHAPLGLPHDAIAVATIDLASIFTMFPAARTELEGELDLPAGALNSLEAMGYDSKRGLTIAVAALTADERKIVADVKPLVKTHQPTPELLEIGKRAVASTSSEVRVLFPATDAKKLMTALGTAFTKDRWHQNGQVFTTKHAVAELSEDGSWVALDIDAEHKGSVDTLHATFANARETPPALDGQTIRGSYDPIALAEFGVLVSLTKAAGAVSGESIDPSQRNRIMAEGAWEAEELIGLAGDAFDRIDIIARAQPFEMSLRAHVAHFVAPAAPLWADTSVAKIDGAAVTIDASRAFVNALGSPQDLIDRMRNGGSLSAIVALPRALLTSPLIAPKAIGLAAPDAVLQDHFERTGVSWTPNQPPIFIGLLPAMATRAAADCALSTKNPCDAKTKLKLGAVIPLNNGFAKLVQVDKRFVVMTADEAASLAGTVKMSMAGPVRIEMDTAPVIAKLHTQLTLPKHVGVTVTNDATSLLIKLH